MSEHLPGKPEALSSNFSIAKNQNTAKKLEKKYQVQMAYKQNTNLLFFILFILKYRTFAKLVQEIPMYPSLNFQE